MGNNIEGNYFVIEIYVIFSIGPWIGVTLTLFTIQGTV